GRTTPPTPYLTRPPSSGQQAFPRLRIALGHPRSINRAGEGRRPCKGKAEKAEVADGAACAALPRRPGGPKLGVGVADPPPGKGPGACVCRGRSGASAVCC